MLTMPEKYVPSQKYQRHQKHRPIVCTYYECNKWVKSRALCATHYQAALREGITRIRPGIGGRPKIHDALSRKLAKTLHNINHRCTNPTDKRFKYYGGKGIQNHLTLADLQFLWVRDKADQLAQPSIDRIDNSTHYTLANCQFIEMAENRRKRLRFPYLLKWVPSRFDSPKLF
jgi:hypothetical protein